MGLLLIFLFSALLISFLCSILEAVLLSTPLTFLAIKEEEGSKSASKFKKLKQNSARPISAILSLNTIANTIGAAGVGSQATEVFGSKWFGLVSAITTILILVFSEIIPKTIGSTKYKSLVGFASKSISIIMIVMWPIVEVLQIVSKIIGSSDNDATISREEVSAMANVAEEEGDLEEDENAIIQNLIKMDEIYAYQAMTPRVVCATAPETMSLKSFWDDKSFVHHSRIPVYADDDEYISGYILRIDALQLLADDQFERTLGSIKRDISSFNKDQSLDLIWDEMKSKDEQISVIIDEYGCFQGILTLEDIIETLLGSEIVDENDNARDMQQLARDKWSNRKKGSDY